MSENTSGSLFAKMARVMGRLNGFQKQGKYASNKANFDFVRAQDVFDDVREAMAAEKLACIPNLISVEEMPGSSDRSLMFLVTFQFTFCDGDTGDTFSTMWKTSIAQFGGNDKILNQAATIGLKVFLMTTFIVNAGDNDEDQTAPPRNHQDRAITPRPQHTAPPAQNDLAQQIEGYLDDHGITPDQARNALGIKSWAAFPSFEIAKKKIDEKLLAAPAEKPQPSGDKLQKAEIPF